MSVRMAAVIKKQGKKEIQEREFVRVLESGHYPYGFYGISYVLAEEWNGTNAQLKLHHLWSASFWSRKEGEQAQGRVDMTHFHWVSRFACIAIQGEPSDKKLAEAVVESEKIPEILVLNQEIEKLETEINGIKAEITVKRVERDRIFHAKIIEQLGVQIIPQASGFVGNRAPEAKRE